ncbi:hypothetical protein OFB99_23345, partial [Escherichia coli]|nr:hypothetical protein [Escherichia coli]MCV5168508.1 hypothetical protein [Escherichia coli]
ADRNRSHWSTSKTPSYTKSVSWQHHQDSEEGLTHILSEHFENVKTKVQGTVVMFSASGKK